jgi:RNA polymerase sigma-70 factor (ECF subfamily)
MSIFGRGLAQADHQPEHSVQVRSELRIVIDGIAQLPSRDRQLVGLRIAADLGYAEIGRIMGMTERAATVATSRALARVRSYETERTR